MGGLGIGYKVGRSLVKVMFAGRNNQKFMKLIHDNTPPDNTPIPVHMPTAVKDLTNDSGLSIKYLEALAHNVRHKGDVAAIMQYLKSGRAYNLTAEQKADLIRFCVDRLHWIDVIQHFL